ncbi:Crp/Fnr family transcriptional regulator [Dietzia sp. B32]|uniref:Crp/Fnr family transcriptional regulator n=1 Tax=Dietzia sp. B32 TaxID=2915130 RepID=UPI0021AD547E|nr:Crp/Fnr family transcriptional regulator [Dietzia sp. B32]UVE96264.1 Crp/Fnr family transcriptional regulator [Dietzia sp. B32]
MTRNPVRRNCAHPHSCSDETRLRVLAESPLTGELTPAEHRDLNRHLSAWSWAEGDPLMLAGDELHGSYLVVSGRVRVTRDTVEGHEITVDIAAPGDPVGPLRSETGTAIDSAWAMETTCALFLPAEALAEVVGNHPRFALAVLQQQQERLEQAREREIGHATRSVEQRVGSVLRYLDDKLGSRQRDGASLLQVRLRRDDIAGLAGTTVESASRVMARLKKAGVIDSGREWVSILDHAALDRVIDGK